MYTLRGLLSYCSFDDYRCGSWAETIEVLIVCLLVLSKRKSCADREHTLHILSLFLAACKKKIAFTMEPQLN